MITWNVGGLTPQKVAEVMRAVRDSAGTILKEVYDCSIVFLQDVTADVGVQHHHIDGWHMIVGKGEGDWRGVAIVYREGMGTYADTVSAKAAVATTLTNADGRFSLRLVSIHIPHHATNAETEQILEGLQMEKHRGKFAIGMDANETFVVGARGHRAKTNRGEIILNWITKQGGKLPEQSMQQASFYPYNTAQTPRRLDYIVTKGLVDYGRGMVESMRDIAMSDHEPVVLPFPWGGKRTRGPTPWSPRRLKEEDKVEEALTRPWGGHPELAIANVAKDITIPGKAKMSFEESQELKQLRREARRQPPGGERRKQWKDVYRLQKKERRQWQRDLQEQAVQGNWLAARSLEQRPTVKWEHRLLDDPNWREKLQEHFEGIFCKKSREEVDEALNKIRWRLTLKCKHTVWTPFDVEELRMAAANWSRGKSTGPDGISHEALLRMLDSADWRTVILWTLNDYFYKGEIPANTGKGATILLPKITAPTTWGDTRPITLSSSMLKWLSQLLLLRAGEALDSNLPYQWARRGKQATELLFLVRRLVRMARDWGIEFWIAKIDVKKAFDSVWQESLAEVVERRIGESINRPWEARVWLALLGAREIEIQTDGGEQVVAQSNGVRQGSPDSPKLFATLIGEVLNTVFAKDKPKEESKVPVPHPGASFMDDTYLWAEKPDTLQYYLGETEKELKKDGLEINQKTMIICTHATTRCFQIGGGKIAAQGPEAVMNVLGAPVSFDMGPAVLAAEMANRARRAFHSRKRILRANGPVKSKLMLHNTYVRGAALWGCQAWPAHKTILTACNTVQLQQVRDILDIKRGTGESWVDWNSRSMRLARAQLHQQGLGRWSTHALTLLWGLVGHISRGEGVGGDILEWRGMKWWKEQQNKRQGERHAGRFNPQLDIERAVTSVAGIEWRQIAKDRQAWAGLEAAFLDKFDTPWSTGRQTAITNLSPNNSAKPSRGKQPALKNE